MEKGLHKNRVVELKKVPGVTRLPQKRVNDLEKAIKFLTDKGHPETYATFVIGSIARRIKGKDKRKKPPNDCDILHITKQPLAHEIFRAHSRTVQITSVPINHFGVQEIENNLVELDTPTFERKYFSLLDAVPLMNPEAGEELQRQVKERLSTVLGEENFQKAYTAWEKKIRLRRGEPE